MNKFDNIKLERDNAAMQRPLSMVGLAAVLFALVGCDSVYQEDSYRQDKHWPTAVVVSGVPATFLIDAEPIQLSATDQGGAPIAVTWSSSDPAVASVNSSGLVSVWNLGTTQIVATATQGGKSGAVVANVQPVVTTLAGSGDDGDANGRGASASFTYPRGITVDSAGIVYVADTYNNKIRKIKPSGLVTTLAGTGGYGSVNGPGTSATFDYPFGIAVDRAGNLYISDTDNYKVRKISPAGIVTTLAGTGDWGDADGSGTSASFRYHLGITVDSVGILYVADTGNNKIRKITPSGLVTTLAGTGDYGSVNGLGTLATFDYPCGITVESAGNLYVADTNNNIIRKITSAGVVTTFAGSEYYGSDDGIGTSASFYNPKGITVDSTGTVYVADTGNNKIRKITAAGVVTTLAGSGYSGSADGIGTSASFNYPGAITVDRNGNLYVADTYNHTIRKIQTKRNP